MPVVTTPPRQSNASAATSDEGDHGGGRRPPTDKRTGRGEATPTTGTIGGRGRSGPRERLDRLRLGLFFGLSAGVHVLRSHCERILRRARHNACRLERPLHQRMAADHYSVDPVPEHGFVADQFANRGDLRGAICSARWTVMDEWLGLGKPTSRAAMPWLATTIVLGSLFVVGQIVAWNQLAMQRVHYDTSPSAHSFFLITGVHGLHLIVGVLALIAGVRRALRLENSWRCARSWSTWPPGTGTPWERCGWCCLLCCAFANEAFGSGDLGGKPCSSPCQLTPKACDQCRGGSRPDPDPHPDPHIGERSS